MVRLAARLQDRGFLSSEVGSSLRFRASDGSTCGEAGRFLTSDGSTRGEAGSSNNQACKTLKGVQCSVQAIALVSLGE